MRDSDGKSLRLITASNLPQLSSAFRAEDDNKEK